jgi:beta-galactosidase
MQNKLFTRMFHGCDYNPDQWLGRPDILAEDIEYMKKAGVNCVSLGIFSWTALEPAEGQYDFGWLGEIIENLHQNGISTFLATPGAARPAWMAKQYPEVLRVGADLVRNEMGARHNHCYTSPVYRDKVYAINKKLSERFGKHPAVLLWHLSNEYGGDCFCPLCTAEFRLWLEKKYKTVDAVNDAWWMRFWSHTYTGWSQIDPPLQRGEHHHQGLKLDWMRFVTDRHIDFMKWEIKAVRDGGSELPVTANFMGFYDGLNYQKFREILDVVSWDSYPGWHDAHQSDTAVAAHTAAAHDLMRSILPDKPFLLMESTPSTTNWFHVSKVKAPGMHMLASMQAVAHGSDSVQYFQWRKGRGGSEKFHGAVVSHDRRSDTRVFKDVAQLGERLAGLGALAGSVPHPQAAVIYDWENNWAIKSSAGPRNAGLRYQETVKMHHRALWELGIGCDMPGMEADFSRYKLIAAPMLYMQRAGIVGKLRRFVEDGGVLVGTCFSGLADENDLCFLSDAPNGLTDVFGLRAEEISGLHDGEVNHVFWNDRCHSFIELIELVRTEGASVPAVFENDFYRNEPALCENTFGKGKAYYIAGGAQQLFLNDFYAKLAADFGLERALDADELPAGVTAQTRVKDDRTFIIAQNYNQRPVAVHLRTPVRDLETGDLLSPLVLPSYGVKVLERV